MRTLAALLTFFTTFVVAWAVLALLCLAFVERAGFEDEAALGLALFVAPVMAYFTAIFSGVFVMTPRRPSATG